MNMPDSSANLKACHPSHVEKGDDLHGRGMFLNFPVHNWPVDAGLVAHHTISVHVVCPDFFLSFAVAHYFLILDPRFGYTGLVAACEGDATSLWKLE